MIHERSVINFVVDRMQEPFNLDNDPLRLIRDPDPWLLIPPRDHGSLISALIYLIDVRGTF